MGQGGGVITTVSNPVPQRSRRRTAEMYGKAETGPAPTMYSGRLRHRPRRGQERDADPGPAPEGRAQVLERAEAESAPRRRREDEVVLDDRDDDEDMVDEFGSLFPVGAPVGERVEVRQRKGRKEEVWVLGRVKASSAVGYDVVLDDGRVESCAARSVRPADEDGLNLIGVVKEEEAAQAGRVARRRSDGSGQAADFFAVGLMGMRCSAWT